MTNIPSSHAPDDSLDRATDALRRAAVPDGPSDETIARTLAALHAASKAEAIPFYRKKPIGYAWKIAVAGLLAAGVAVYFTGVWPMRSPLAFAEIAAKLRDAHTLTCQVTLKNPDRKEPAKMKLFFKEPGWERAEGAGQINIIDLKQNKILVLDSKTKTAMLVEIKKTRDAAKDTHENAFELIERLRKLAGQKSESVGKMRVGDIEAEGFRTEEEGVTLTVWADPKTKMPVLIEMPVRIQDKETLVTLSDFQVDVKLDDTLFSLEPPEGYKLRKMEMEDAKPEEDAAHLLRAYADKFDGKFPKDLSVASADWQTYIKQRWGDEKPKGLSEPEVVRFMQRLIRMQLFLAKDKDHGYKPDGVKLGDRDKIVFWYRPDKADKYRAVFGDLHVADVSADQLPEKPKK